MYTEYVYVQSINIFTINSIIMYTHDMTFTNQMDQTFGSESES